MPIEGIVRAVFVTAALAGSSLVAACQTQQPQRYGNTAAVSAGNKEGFLKYMEELHRRCQDSKKNPLNHEEHIFRQYVEWLGKISGRKFDPEKLDVVPDNVIYAFLESGLFAGLMELEDHIGGFYINGKPRLTNKKDMLGGIAHEYGHATDEHLNTMEYLTNRRDRAIAEAVAEAFQDYAALMLITEEAEREGRAMLEYIPQEGDKIEPHMCTLKEVTGYNESHAAGRHINAMLMNEFVSIRGVWMFLAKTPRAEVAAKLEEIARKKDCAHEAIRTGYSIMRDERTATIGSVQDKLMKEGRLRRN